MNYTYIFVDQLETLRYEASVKVRVVERLLHRRLLATVDRSTLRVSWVLRVETLISEILELEEI